MKAPVSREDLHFFLSAASGQLMFPNFWRIVIFEIQEQEIGIPEIINYSVF